MYPIELDSLLDKKDYIKKPILFFSCISFEQRCITAAKNIFNSLSSNVIWGFFQLIDNGSHYEEKCTSIQNEILNEITELIYIEASVPEFNLFDTSSNENPVDSIIEYFKTFLKNDTNIGTVILDITTIPKICYIPFLKWLLDEGLDDKDFIICYTKPEEYGNETESGPINPPTIIIGDYEEEKEILFVPLLGFKSTFTMKILKNLRKDGEVEKIIPIISFPAYRPEYFDKVLTLHAKEDDAELNESLLNPILAAADNPFHIYNQITEIVNSYSDKYIILSPLGPKPMSVGLVIAAIKYNLPVIVIQARNYHPNYSIGEGLTSCYWIKRDGKCTF